MRLEIRVTPRASKNEVAGMRDGKLLVRVTAPPVDDAANEAVVELIARTLHVPKRAVRIVSAQTSRNKTIEIDGAEPAALARLTNG
jgi:uncharacterized protein (TIGR00251 family)